MKGRIVIISSLIVFVIIVFGIFLVLINRYDTLNKSIALSNISNSCIIKIYSEGQENSYINVLSNENKNSIIDMLNNLKVKKNISSISKNYDSAYKIEINYGGNDIFLMQVGDNCIRVNGKNYYVQDIELYNDLISEIFLSEKKIQNLDEKSIQGIVSKVSAKLYNIENNAVYKELGYDDTQKLFYYLNLDSQIFDGEEFDENKLIEKCRLQITQIDNTLEYTLYDYSGRIVFCLNSDNEKRITSYTNIKEIELLLQEIIEFDDGLIKIDMMSENDLPDLYVKDKKILSRKTSWPYSNNAMMVSSAQLTPTSYFLQDDEVVNVLPSEELKISTNSNRILPDDTYIYARYDGLDKQIKITRKSDGNYYIRVPEKQGEYIVSLNVEFLLSNKAGEYAFKIVVK